MDENGRKYDMYVVKEYKSRKILFEQLTKVIREELSLALRKKRKVTLAVPGGTTPKLLFNALSLEKIEWKRVVVIPTDERCVDESDSRSNGRFIRSNLLINYAKDALYNGLSLPDCSPSEIVDRCKKDIGSNLPIDVCILGMGVDMHIASIFPDSDRLDEALAVGTHEILVPIDAPSLSETRITLTAEVLKGSGSLHIILTGYEKKVAFEKSLNLENKKEAPVRSVLFRNDETFIHYAD